MALNISSLEDDIRKMIEETMPQLFEDAFKSVLPQETDEGNAIAKRFSKTITNGLSKQWPSRLAQTIDSYIKNIELYGTVLTTGGPTTQTAMINCVGSPVVNGGPPNTIGIR